MKQYIPNTITCLNLLTGLTGMIWMFQGNPKEAIYFVLVAGLFDFFDGFSARLLKVQSPMGKELDSLADMVSFSVLPAIFLFVHLQSQSFSIAPYFALLIAPFSALRLAKFNIDENQSDKFIGLPTPANALLITSLYLIGWDLPEWLWVIIAIFSALILVAPIEMIALKFKNYALKDNLFRYTLIVLSVTIVVVLGMPGIVFVIPTYILLSILSNYIPSKE